jgi:hypothetical protein
MDTNLVKTVAMFGPSISEPSKIVNRDVPECDIQAYKAAGYKLGSIKEEKEPAKEVPVPKPVEVLEERQSDTAKKKGKK